MKAVIIAILFVVGVFSQSYMQNPPGRLQGGQLAASQVAPCGEGVDSPSPNWYAGGTYPITWKQNGNSDDPVYINLLKEVTVDTVITFNTTINGTEVENSTVVSQTNITFYRFLRTLNYNTGTYNLRVPSDVPAGLYYLQWNWTNYYSCALINMSADPVGWKILTPTQTRTNLVPVQTFHYYELSIEGDQQNFVEIDGTGPSQPNAYITVVGKRNFTPLPNITAGSYSQMTDTTGHTDYALSFCRDNVNIYQFAIGVVGSAGADPSSTYTITANLYNPLVDANNQINSQKHNGKKYYYTDSYETEKRRRLVLSSEQDFTGPLKFTLANNCGQSNTLIPGTQIGTSKGCIQLPATTNIKYIEVSPQTSPYTLSVEVGECGEVSASSVATYSLLLLFVVLAIVF